MVNRSLTTPEFFVQVAAHQSGEWATLGPSPQESSEYVSDAWYLVPFFFGIIRGIIAWDLTKDRDSKKARNLLIFGLVWTVVGALVVFEVVAFLIVVNNPIGAITLYP